jgi:hypothetical protein
MSDIPVKDRTKEIEYVRAVLNMVDINVTYTGADLIITVMDALKKKGDKFSIQDGVTILFDHKKKWEDYFKDKETPH